MGQYKVPQDVEAEDKILGPLTLKQFIYGAIGVGWAFLTFFLFARLNFLIWIVVMFPVTGFFALLAGFRRDGQDFESLLMSLVGYFAQPRQRIWLKEPIAEVFRVEPPKIIQEQTQRDPEEVRSQLEQLASLVDSRGKIHERNVPLPEVSIPSLEGQGTYVMPEERTIAIPESQASPTNLDLHEADDVLDFEHNESAQAVNTLVDQSEEQLRARALEQMRAQLARTPEAHPAHASPVTPSTSGAIIKQAMESDDLSVSQVAAQANRVATLSEGETVILRDGTGTSQ